MIKYQRNLIRPFLHHFYKLVTFFFLTVETKSSSLVHSLPLA
jgi:hypothetical protein